MGKIKQATGSSKSTAVSYSRKRARTETEPNRPRGQCSVWTASKRLSDCPKEWREQLYRNKLEKVQLKHDLIIAEKRGNLSDFKHYGLTDAFERLGWLNALSIQGFDQTEVYLDDIITWIATLKKIPGTNPPRTTKLVGTVRGEKVELSFRALDRIGEFDNSGRPYEYLSEAEVTSEGKDKGPMWIEMLRELFAVPEHKLSMSMGLDRNLLKPLPKLMSIILTWNILPRASDKSTIRNCDVRILYALCTGQLMISFKQLVLHSVWEARENKPRLKIPHCRLLSRLLMNANVLPENARVYNIGHRDFDIQNIRDTEFTFTKSRFVYVLEDAKGKRTFEVPRDQNDVDQEEDDGIEDDDEIGDDEERAMREYDIVHQTEDDTRPRVEVPPTWGGWSTHEREMWKRQEEEFAQAKAWREEQAKLAQERWEKQEAYEKSRIYEREWEYNRRYAYMEEMRQYFDRVTGLRSTPCPKGYHSAWLPLQSHQPSNMGEGQSTNSQQNHLDMQVIHTNLMESLFHPPILIQAKMQAVVPFKGFDQVHVLFPLFFFYVCMSMMCDVFLFVCCM